MVSGNEDLCSGVHSTNTVVRKFEGVSKPDYHIVEQQGDPFEPDDSAISVVDVRLLFGDSDERKRFVAALGESLRTIGFAVLVNHGVDKELTNQAHDSEIKTTGGLLAR